MLRNPLRLPPTTAARVAVPRIRTGGGGSTLIGIGAIVVLGVLMVSGLLVWSASSVWVKLGVGKQAEVEVVSTSLRASTPGWRTSQCDRRVYHVQWDSREGEFTECATKPVSQRVGDRLRVSTVPWNDVVARPGDLPSPVQTSTAVVVIGSLILWGAVILRRGRRISSGRATGWEFNGRVVETGRNSMEIRLDTGVQMGLLPAARSHSLVAGERVSAFAGRRSWFLRQPSGPWVVAAKPGQARATVFTHGWVRRKV